MLDLRVVVLYVLGQFEIMAEKTQTWIDDYVVRMLKQIVQNEELYKLLLKLIATNGGDARGNMLRSSAEFEPMRTFCQAYDLPIQSVEVPNPDGESSRVDAGWIQGVLAFVSMVRTVLQLWNIKF